MHKTKNIVQDLVIVCLVILVALLPIWLVYSRSKSDTPTLEMHCTLIGGSWHLKSKGVYICEFPITD